MRRILAIILAVLMIGSVCGTLFYNLMIMRVYAADERLMNSDADADSLKVRIGLMYGSNVTVGFETTAPYGFTVCRVERNAAGYPSEPIWELNETKVSCTVDGNLSKSAMTYSKLASGERTVIGGWHAELVSDSPLDRDGLTELISELNPTLAEIGVYAIPSYIDGEYRLRAGHFESEALANSIIEKINQRLPGLKLRAVGPTDTGVSVVNPDADRVLFEYDCGDVTALGLAAQPSSDGASAYLVTPAKKMYDGVFMFRRYNSSISSSAGSVDGVSLTDIIELGEYIKGVLPYEISNSWPIESQKAFAICVRSYTLSLLNRHEAAYQFDLCNTTQCQVYGGRGRINDTVERAVEETAGMVLSYDGKIVTAFYSAVQGGVTVSSEDAWGGVIPYLTAIETPWEIYTGHSKGQWTTEVSATELCTYLRDVKGYTQLRGKIASITIDKLATNSTYIAQLTITDSYGTSVTIKKSDAIRTALAKYVYSANFVVGKGSVEADITTFSTESAESTSVRSASGSATLKNDISQSILTGAGLAVAQNLQDVSVQASNGVGTLGKIVSTTTRTTLKASSADNFIFAGKGYGHGVGLSQVGLMNLADAGVSAADMLRMYLANVEIIDYRQLAK